MTQVELSRPRELKQQIDFEEQRLKTLLTTADNIVQVLDGMPHARRQTSRVEKVATLIVEIEEKIAALKAEFETACVNLARKLREENLTSQELNVVTLRYVACMNFRDIEFELNMSDARVFYTHRHALKSMFSRATVGQQSDDS